MKYFLSISISILLSTLIWAQEGTITGKITDAETGESLIGATVVFESAGVSTDVEGKYRLKLPSGKHKVKFSFIGYEAKFKEVDVEDGLTIKLDMSLSLESHQHQTVVISASQYEKNIEEETVSASVVSGENLIDRNATDVGQAISKTSGVLVQDGQVSIRGGSSYSYGVGSRTAVLVDGMSVMSADLGDAKLKFAPTENTEQIEVIKGSASVVYGSSALNGVVNVLTAWPKSDKASHEIVTFGTVYDRTPIKSQQWWTKFSTRGAMGLSYLYDQKIGRTDVVVGTNIYRHQSYLEENDELRGRVSVKTRVHNKKKKGLNYGLNYTLMFEQNERFFLARDLDTNAFRVADGSDDRYMTMNLDPHLHYADSLGNRHSADFRWLYIHRFGNGADPDAISNQFIENYQYQKNWGWNKNKLMVKRPEHRVILTTGAPATFGISSSNLYTGLRETYSAAAYLQGEYKLIWADGGAVRRADRTKSGNSDTLRALSLIAGVRYEILGVEDIFESGLPVFRTGLNLKFGRASFFRTSFGQSYRLPSVGERYITNDLFNTLRVIANPQLQPEKGWNLEFGVSQGFQIANFKAGIDAAFFWQQYKQFVEYRFVTSSSNPDLFQSDSLFIGLFPSNVENARVGGFEVGLTGSGKIGDFEIVPSLGYTYTYPVNVDSFGTSVGKYLEMMFADLSRRVPDERKGQILQFRSRHLFVGDLAINWKNVTTGFSFYYGSYPEVIPETFGLAVGFLSGDFASFDRYGEQHQKGDWVFDVRFGYKISSKLKAGFIIKNVANRYYSTRPSMPEPIRNFTLQLQVRI